MGSGRSLDFSGYMRAVFLDRDGVINEDNPYDETKDLIILPNVGIAIKKLNETGLKVIVVTNQPSVARGQISEDEITKLHRTLEETIKENGSRIDAFYYCPHH